jgi:aldose 1-epimerase
VVAPSGEQYEIRLGAQSAVVVEVGGGLRSYEVDGRPVFDSYDSDEVCDGARGQTLVPWPNRVQDGKWSWQDTELQLALTEPEQNNAIHGLVRWLGWSLVERSESAVTLGCTSHAQPGYPWTLQVQNVWALAEDGISVTTTVVNRSDEPAPVAVGFHPYITVGTETINTALLTVPAKTRLMTGYQQIPIGRAPVNNTAYDFRTPYPLEDLEIDHTFTELIRDGDGRARVRLEDPDGTSAVTVWVDAAYPYIEIYSGDTLRPDRRRRGLGVEPMSAPPNALVSGEGVVTIATDQQWRGRWGIDPFAG